MEEKSRIAFLSIGELTIIREKFKDTTSIYYEAVNKHGDTFIVQESLTAEEYSFVKDKIYKLQSVFGNCISVPTYSIRVADRFIAYKPISSKYPIGIDEWKDVTIQIESCLQLIKAFDEISLKGLVVKAFKESNIGIDPQTGNVCLDIFNELAFVGKVKSEEFISSHYILPTSEIADVPNEWTSANAYTLSVLLFEILIGSNPFDGRLLATKAFLRKEDIDNNYVGSRIFIFDPNINENAPIPGIQDYAVRRWDALPDAVRDAFVQTFSCNKTLLTPKSWQAIIERAKDNLYKCPSCKRMTYYKMHDQKSCIWCGRDIDATYGLKNSLNGRIIPLIDGAEISDGSCNKDVSGKVVRKNGKLIIQNISKYPWSATTPKGIDKKVNPNDAMPVNPGIKVRIGYSEYIIE